MAKSVKKKKNSPATHDDPSLSKNYGEKRKFRVRVQEDKELEKELKRFLKEENAS